MAFKSRVAREACRPIAALIRARDRFPFDENPRILNAAATGIHDAERAAVRTALTEESKRLARQKVARELSSWGHFFQSLGFELDKVDGETIRARLLRAGPRLSPLAEQGAAAFDAWKVAVIQAQDEMNQATTLLRRLQHSGMRSGLLQSKLAYLAFATGNADGIVKAARMLAPRDAPRAVRQRIRRDRLAALRSALLDDSKARDLDDYAFNDAPLDKLTRKAHVENWLRTPAHAGGPTEQMLDDMGELYRIAGDSRDAFRKDWIEWFERTNGRRPSEDEIFKEIGGTFGAFMPRIWLNQWKSGYLDDLITASNNGVFEFNLSGIHTNSGVLTLPQLIRRINKISDGAPLVLGGQTFRTKTEALTKIFPSLSSREVRETIDILGHMSTAANDTLFLRALPNPIHDIFYRHRLGMLGFEQDFIDSMGAYISAGSRARRLGPQFREGGAMHDFLREVMLADAPFANQMARYLDMVMGRNGIVDRELVGLMHPLVRMIANAIFALNPGPALMNISGVFLQAIPYAFSDGFAAGARDLAFAVSLLTKSRREFFHFFDESRLGGSFAYGMSTSQDKLRQLVVRLDDVTADGDLAGAFRAVKEIGISGSEFLAFTESAVVRPFSAALGLARFYRLNPAAAQLGELTGEHLEGAWREMMRVIDQTTTLQGGVNSPPWLNRIKSQFPVVGSTATMLTVTPVNLFSQFLRDIRRVVYPGTPGLRAPATRRLLVQSTFGTLFAGPFWFVPLLRDSESSEDKDAIIAWAEEFERRFSLAGLLNTELAQRLHPVFGVTDRFVPHEGTLPSLLFGPLGRPVSDILSFTPVPEPISGGAAGQRRALGFLSGLADLPPDAILPSSIQYLIPGGVGFEKLAKVLATFMLEPSPTGSQSFGSLDIPVPTLDGNRVDVQGRPFVSSGETSSKVRSFFFGGRALDEAQIASEGVRREKKETRRQRVEGQLRRLILDGDIEAASRMFLKNSDVDPEITVDELEREKLSRLLLPQARQVLHGPVESSVERMVEAAQRLQAGNLTPVGQKNELHILLAGLIRFGGER